ncbi:O-antigen ligase family protein [Halomonas halodenitrificans]|uniref:O-antigen ligase family protein n=1 Tax=Halomonas halodenitrificans TaxID=28252 RepID=UPI000A8E2E1E|nr:O-antigen ligase family protein [Halomonas halodenitrificans]
MLEPGSHIKDGLPPDVRLLQLRLGPIAYWLAAFFLWSLVLDSPFRYGLSLVNLEVLIYVPKLLLCVAVALLFLLRPQASPAAWLLSGLAVLYLFWGMLNLDNPLQAVFGFWVVVPLLFGLWIGSLVQLSHFYRLFRALFVVTLLGLFFDPLIAYPWSGQSMTIFGSSVEISRQWSAFGIERYAGFTRASFNTASQLLMFGMALVVSLERRWLKALVWLLAGAGIAMTTSKGPFGAWMLLSVYFIGGAILHWARLWVQLWLILFGFILIVMVVVPLSTLWINYDPGLQRAETNFFLASFGDRLNWMWPDSFRLLTLDGNYHWWFGRGLGGVGAAQKHFEPDHYFAADNLFVYLSVSLGTLVAIFLIVALFVKVVLVSLQRDREAWFLPVMLFVSSYGVVTNIVESSLVALFFGLAASHLKNGY